MSSFLEVRNLSKSYDDTIAVNNISFKVERGEFVALLGPSGCGKSTTLKMLAGLEQCSSGVIEINGENVIDKSPGKRNLSMVFQSYALYPHMTVKENIVFGLKARKVHVAERAKRLDSVLRMVDLGPHINKKPAQLSGGQCQRVALARAIVSNAPLCLMDEPLSNLDTQLRAEMRTEIRALQKKLGLTVIYVTHDQIEAMSMADRIILINQGAIEQSAAPEGFYDAPSTTFVASFIGQPPMNLFSRDDVLVGVRPEHVSILDEKGVVSTVLDCDYQGAETIVSVRQGESVIKMCLAGRQSLPVGSDVNIGWGIQHEHYFNPATGKRLVGNH